MGASGGKRYVGVHVRGVNAWGPKVRKKKKLAEVGGCSNVEDMKKENLTGWSKGSLSAVSSRD